jgi:hypothetical protein
MVPLRRICFKKNDHQTMIYKILHRKLKIENDEPPLKPRVNLGAPEG